MRITKLPPAPFLVIEIDPRRKVVVLDAKEPQDAGEPGADLFGESKVMGSFVTYEGAQSFADLMGEYLAPRAYVVTHRGRALRRRDLRMQRYNERLRAA